VSVSGKSATNADIINDGRTKPSGESYAPYSRLYARTCLCALFFLWLAIFPDLSFAQGSIFGSVQNSDLSIPANGSVSFFGFINDSDAEIRTDLSIGAGYDNGNWFDDFQNYLSESAGQPYDYFFYNTANSEGAHLAGAIPSNSFQQENIALDVAAWPLQPTGVFITDVTVSAVSLRWNYDTTLTYHIYRRPATSAGSFFRIDNPSGALTDAGVADSVFVDTAVDGTVEYDYFIIGENMSGAFSPRSELSIPAPAGCCVLPGDVNQDGRRNIADITYFISFIFSGGPAPGCRDQADVNSDNRVNIADVTYLITWVFQGGPEPVCGTTGSIQPINTNDSFTGSS
jgi:Dockerin type I domain